jgi:hypothetical protein
MASPLTELNRSAREECEAFNRRAKREAVEVGEDESRAWLHPDDWVRMRPSLALLVAIARLDGTVRQAEAEVISDWARWRLTNSHWGGAYTNAKVDALMQLVPALTPDMNELVICIDAVNADMSDKQRAAFLKRVEAIRELAGEPGEVIAAVVIHRLQRQPTASPAITQAIDASPAPTLVEMMKAPAADVPGAAAAAQEPNRGWFARLFS